ncbi:MAG: tRNA glutamyl-Q(34) synthetase GluQRS [Pseudomonadota bacterium]
MMKQRFKATRFAPSPTGPLHFGSLVCAVASYLFAKQHDARWLVRIEDIDKQRCKPENIDDIIRCLHAHGLKEDGPIVLQSQRSELYKEYIEKLKTRQLIYACDCSRKMIKQRARYYDGFCRERNLLRKNNALRFKNLDCPRTFSDLHFQIQHTSLPVAHEDPVLRRADGQYNYNLAMIVDDIEQGIDLVVRGADLLDQTPLHQHLFTSFDAPAPAYFHIPLAVHSKGVKYAKQSFSPAINNKVSSQNLASCLVFLGIPIETIPRHESVDTLIAWAVSAWQPSLLARRKEIAVIQSNDVYSPHYS